MRGAALAALAALQLHAARATDSQTLIAQANGPVSYPQAGVVSQAAAGLPSGLRGYNTSVITQTGSYSYASTEQTGYRNTASVTQSGSGNSAALTQNSDYGLLNVTQTGNGIGIVVTQTGHAPAITITQTRPGR